MQKDTFAFVQLFGAALIDAHTSYTVALGSVDLN